MAPDVLVPSLYTRHPVVGRLSAKLLQFTRCRRLRQRAASAVSSIRPRRFATQLWRGNTSRTKGWSKKISSTFGAKSAELIRLSSRRLRNKVNFGRAPVPRRACVVSGEAIQIAETRLHQPNLWLPGSGSCNPDGRSRTAPLPWGARGPAQRGRSSTLYRGQHSISQCDRPNRRSCHRARCLSLHRKASHYFPAPARTGKDRRGSTTSIKRW